jgi:hypothetical protein
MKLNLRTFLITLAVVAIPFSAAQAEETKFEPKLKIGGLIFANYHYDLTDGAAPNNKFEVNRVYLNFKAKMTEDFSARVTTDVGTIKSYEADQKIRSFLKYAYVEYKNKDLGMKLRFGAAGTPFIGKHDKFVGQRWISKAFADQVKVLSSSDLGLHVMGKHMDGMIDYQVSVINGSGYGKKEADDGKAAQFRFTLDPLAGGEMSLPISAFVSYDVGAGSDAAMIAAASLGFKHDMGKAWGEFLFTSADDITGMGFSATLLPKIPSVGNLMVRLDRMDPDTSVDDDAMMRIIGGVTHDFAKKISVGLIYERSMPEAGDDSHAVFVKTQAGF